MSGDRGSSIELGVSFGYGYASRHHEDRVNLGRIASARSASDVTANVDPAELPVEEILDPVAFWSGFAHGVRWYVLEEARPAG